MAKRKFFRRVAERSADRLARIAAATPRPVEDVRPALRQPAPAQQTTVGERPWWARAEPGTMTSTAEAERARMEQSRIARTVTGRVNEV